LNRVHNPEFANEDLLMKFIQMVKADNVHVTIADPTQSEFCLHGGTIYQMPVFQNFSNLQDIWNKIKCDECITSTNSISIFLANDDEDDDELSKTTINNVANQQLTLFVKVVKNMYII
jgi:mannose/fructose/N-acetylgalactosamine-specific phosphotransferase system component IIB